MSVTHVPGILRYLCPRLLRLTNIEWPRDGFSRGFIHERYGSAKGGRPRFLDRQKRLAKRCVPFSVSNRCSLPAPVMEIDGLCRTRRGKREQQLVDLSWCSGGIECERWL